MKIKFLLLLLLCTINCSMVSDPKKLKVLHLSFHQGCINDFKDVAKELDLNVTSWFIFSPGVPREHFDGFSSNGLIYSITHDRAQKVWERYKYFFATFDVIVTSDTAPLSRIFLQHGWQKPLIIWICNRFDFYDKYTRDHPFPDQEYYDLFNKATKQDTVKIIGYTPYEHEYVATKGITTGGLTIKPIGTKSDNTATIESYIPHEIEKGNTLFIYPSLTDQQANYFKNQCDALGIPTYSGKFNGPDDIKDFKGVLYIPYQISNLAMFENFQRGLIHFVPSREFMKNLVPSPVNAYHISHDLFPHCEWYIQEHKNLLVYFDSWADLKEKIDTIDYNNLHTIIVSFAQQHRIEMLSRWQEVFALI